MTVTGSGDAARGGDPAASPFRIADFRALWTAEVLSTAGDQATRVALTVLVLERTGSVATSATVYALTFLPALLGGLLLGHLADRFPRRAVMVAADLARAGLVALMAVPGLPLPALGALLVVAVLLGGPHTAARSALLPDLLPGPLLARGIALRQVSAQVAQVAGFGGGGLLVAWLTPAGALLADAGTFVLSALVVAVGVGARCAVLRVGGPARAARVSAGRWFGGARAGLALVLGCPRRRYLVAAAWLIGIYILPEALAAAYAFAIGAGPVEAGLLMAADPAGSVLGAVALTVAPPLGERWLIPFAVGAAVPLVLTPFAPGLWAAVALWALSGACATACLIQAQSGFARATPSALRGRATGVASAGLVASQGAAVLLGGVLAQWTDPAAALAVFGAAGAVFALAGLRCLRVPAAPGGLAPGTAG
ncbi:MFS transporter [Pseudonocardia sp. C8]|uniref:MFS transporter n=1 Tax=Pseudonocardia sp. C8 TaxID=2762759 RepID=UPI0016434310|nr:MFS transporter [Pseudonocardia sp. C8]MBC3191415.1 MFS transporter [Pseudonocardia sp. C8]